jgi:hypothetical protein
MLKTYEAVLQGNYLEWSDEVPSDLTEGASVKVFVSILDKPQSPLSKAERGRRMAAALEQLASINTFADIEDPAALEREIRQDRPLPSRDN